MEFQVEFPGNRHWVLNTQFPNVVTGGGGGGGGDIVHLPKELCDIRGLILSTAKGEEKGGGAPLTDHAFQFTVSEEPPRTDWSMVDKRASSCSLEVFTCSSNMLTDIDCLLVLLSKL